MIWRDIMVLILNRINIWIDILYDTVLQTEYNFQRTVLTMIKCHKEISRHI